MKVRHSFSRRTGKRIDATNKHSKPFSKIAEEVVNNSEIILEILDARFIDKTRNAAFENLIKKKRKRLVYVVNKSDLVDHAQIKKKLNEMKVYPFILISCRKRRGTSELRDRIKIEARNVANKGRRGSKNNLGKISVGVIGYPNTGKSSVINLLTGKSTAYVSSESGFTKGIKKIKLNEDIFLLDTPGIIPYGEDSQTSDENLKKHGTIGIKNWHKIRDPDIVVTNLIKKNPGLFEKFYNIQADGDSEILIEELGKKRKMLKKKGRIDIDRVARLILRDWQESKIKSN